MRRCLLVLAALSLLASPARGQVTDHARATRHFEAARAHIAKGRCDLAVSELQASLDFEPSVGARLNLGDCLAQLGKYDEAWRQYKEAEELALSRKDDRIDEARRSSANVAAKMVRVILREPGAPVDGLVVTIDGQKVPASRFNGLLVVPDGTHVVEAHAPDGSRWREIVQGSAGSVVRLTIDLAAESAPTKIAPAAASVTPSDAPSASPASGNVQRTLGLVFGGVGAAAVVVGGVTGVLTIGARADLADAVDASPRCAGRYPDASCAPSVRDEIVPLQDDAYALSTASTVAFIAGGALLAVGAALFFTAPSSEAPSGRGPGRRWALAGPSIMAEW